MKRRIKWNNVIRTLIFVLALYVVIHDTYVVFISQYFTGYLATWTYFGFVTFGFCLYCVISYCEDFKKEMK